MKIILVDAVNVFVSKEGKIFEEMSELLEEYPNRKIILTGADEKQQVVFGLDKMPYEVFTLNHNPEKIDPSYYRKTLEYFNLDSEDVIYFEHDKAAVESAESVGIKTYYYNKDKRDVVDLKGFLDNNV